MTELTSLVIKWAGKEYPIEGLTSNSSVLNLKELIHEKTNVLPARQKLLNLKLKGTLVPRIFIKLKLSREALSSAEGIVRGYRNF